MVNEIPIIVAIAVGIIFVAMSLKTIRKTHIAIIETLGKPQEKAKEAGIVFVVPFIQKLYRVNVTEQIADIDSLFVITSEKMNCKVEGQVYYKVGRTTEQVKASLYNVDNFEYQIVQLATTTLRNIIGKKSFADINSKRSELNREVFDILETETKNWGVNILKVEIKEITPPDKIQDSMNDIINAENIKVANGNYAEATIIKAKGIADAQVKTAEGEKQSRILNSQAEQQEKINLATGEKEAKIKRAEGDATATVRLAEAEASKITTVAHATAQGIEMTAKATAEKYKVEFQSIEENFKEHSQMVKQLDTVATALKDNTKLIITKDTNPTFILGDSLNQTIVPVEKKQVDEKKT